MVQQPIKGVSTSARRARKTWFASAEIILRPADCWSWESHSRRFRGLVHARLRRLARRTSLYSTAADFCGAVAFDARRNRPKAEIAAMSLGGIEHTGLNPAALHALQGRGGTGQVEGSFRGDKVVTVDHNSLVQDSLEELPAHQSETVSKKLAQRTASTRSGSRVQEIMDKYLKAVEGAPTGEEFTRLADTLRQMKNATPQQLKEQLQQFLGRREREDLDGSQAATLLALEEMFGAEKGGEAVLAAIRDVKSELGSQLQSFYKEHVQTFEGTSEVYKQLIGQHGEGDFVESVETLIKKLGGDVQAQGRAMDGPELKAKLDTLYHLEVARNTYSAFSALLDKITKLQAA
jgi:hypothetical protein